MIRFKNFKHKLFHWEYWPMQVVYFPVFFYWIYLSIKSRSLGFFNASNPRIKNGGFALESKKEIYDLLPKSYYPETLFFNANQSLEEILIALKSSTINYPFIIKPDIGLQGLRVEKIHTKEELEQYLIKVDYDFLIQNFVAYKNEIGLFYYRFPNEEKGIISGIVYKDFLIVKGNGQYTIMELIEQNPRFALQLDTLKRKFGEKLNEVLPKDQLLNLVPFGNHVRGSKFTDVSHWINEELTNTFNRICNQIPDFYYGRLDIMFQSRNDLEQGVNFSIIELNGAGSEPTHIYDPKHSIFFAWNEIIKHYKILHQISKQNQQKGHNYLNLQQSIALVRENSKLTKHLKAVS